jgi:hypothetical protein
MGRIGTLEVGREHMNEELELGQNSDVATRQISVEKLGRDGLVFYWPQISEALDATRELWEHCHSKDEILERCISENMQVWVVAHGDVNTIAFITQIFTNRAGKFFEVFWMYGEGMVEALPLLDMALDDFAGKWGCSYIQIVGRKGFERLLRPRGFDFRAATYLRPVRTNVKGN